MKRLVLLTLIVAILAAPALAEKATRDEALTIAKDWVRIVIDHHGTWGGSATAEVTGVQDFSRGDQLLGYYCPVQPAGYVIVSLYKELAAVKAYSDTDNIDPTSDEGMTDLIKGGMERTIQAVEEKTGKSIAASSSSLIASVLDVSALGAWTEIEGQGRPGVGLNYQSGTVMTTTNWQQGDPYNRQCPAGSTCTHTLVGCVATAGAQVMRYYHWPPYGVGSPYSTSYDWPNMANSISSSSTAARIDAVARLSHEVGTAVGMSYGCSASSATTSDMVGVFENTYRYSTSCTTSYRWLYSAASWFSLIVGELNGNQIIQYRIPGHSIVCDGWQVVGVTNQYHMNYGWGGSNTAWYTVDNIVGGDPTAEYVVRGIKPNVSLGATLSGTYTRSSSFPYRYVNVDTIGSSATFDTGQFIQFLPNVTFGSSGTVKISGGSTATRLFTRGDTSKGVYMPDGAITIGDGGKIVLR